MEDKDWVEEVSNLINLCAFAEAEALLQQRLWHDPCDRTALGLLGYLFQLAGRSTDVVRLFRGSVTTVDGDSPGAVRGNERLTDEDLAYLASAHDERMRALGLELPGETEDPFSASERAQQETAAPLDTPDKPQEVSPHGGFPPPVLQVPAIQTQVSTSDWPSGSEDEQVPESPDSTVGPVQDPSTEQPNPEGAGLLGFHGGDDWKLELEKETVSGAGEGSPFNVGVPADRDEDGNDYEESDDTSESDPESDQAGMRDHDAASLSKGESQIENAGGDSESPDPDDASGGWELEEALECASTEGSLEPDDEPSSEELIQIELGLEYEDEDASGDASDLGDVLTVPLVPLEDEEDPEDEDDLEYLDPFLVEVEEDVEPGGSELLDDSGLIGVTREERALQVAMEFVERLGWGPASLPHVHRFFMAFGWSRAKLVLLGEAEGGADPEVIPLAMHLRAYWASHDYLWSWADAYILPPFTLNVLPWKIAFLVCSVWGTPAIEEELEHFVEQEFELWSGREARRAHATSFLQYLSTKLQDMDRWTPSMALESFDEYGVNSDEGEALGTLADQRDVGRGRGLAELGLLRSGGEWCFRSRFSTKRFG